jgi:phytoene dehydrogenase-like protein
MKERVNAVVIGAGVNELVAAHYLARAGLRVLVLDHACAADGFDGGWIPPSVVRDLGLARAGLAIERDDPWAAVALPDGGQLDLWHDMQRSVEAIRRLRPRDAAKWPEFCLRMAQLARVLEALYVAPPPDPLARDWRELARLAGLAFRVRRTGRRGVEDFMRVLAMPVADLLDDWFECDALKGVLGAAGVMHARHGPRAGGTAFRLLHHHAGSPAGVFRQPRSNAARVLPDRPGVEIRRGAKLARIVVREERVAGVELAGGEAIAAPLVVSGLEPARTLTEFVDPGWFDPALVRAVRNIRRRGVVARVTLTLERNPGFARLIVAPSLDYLERAADDAKYGHVSRAPFLEARSERANGEGRYRIDVHAQYAPYTLADGAWNETCTAALGRTVVERLAQHAPQLTHAIIGLEVQSPCDLERLHGHPEGQAHHAELALDQAFWMRPLPDLARYATPIRGLYLCGMAMHPGAGVIGASGANAARVIMRDLRRGDPKHWRT